MQLGMLGLGRMGANMVKRLAARGHCRQRGAGHANPSDANCDRAGLCQP